MFFVVGDIIQRLEGLIYMWKIDQIELLKWLYIYNCHKHSRNLRLIRESRKMLFLILLLVLILGITLDCAQGFPLTLGSGVMHNALECYRQYQELYLICHCQASILSSVLSLWPNNLVFIYYQNFSSWRMFLHN